MIKFDPFPNMKGEPGPAEIDRYLQIARMYREGLGENFPLAVDAHIKLNLEGSPRCQRIGALSARLFGGTDPARPYGSVP
jgi:hypothetical protein